MKRTGILIVTGSVSQLQGIRLARASAGDPFGAATNFLANRGLDDGDFIWATGTDGFIETVPVMFLSEAGPGFADLKAITAAAGELAAAASTAAEAPAGGESSPEAAKPAKKSKKAAAKKQSGKKSSAKSSSKKSSGKKSGKG
jgi:hypothetical protein